MADYGVKALAELWDKIAGGTPCKDRELAAIMAITIANKLSCGSGMGSQYFYMLDDIRDELTGLFDYPEQPTLSQMVAAVKAAAESDEFKGIVKYKKERYAASAAKE